ncbi:MAG: RHS repeat protein [Clostridiales bacterium]|nr:RHS repeat protein [Clostridiales bacterium]
MASSKDSNDSLGRVVSVISHIDAAGQISTATDKNGNSTYYERDCNGNVTTVTDSLGHSSHFVHDLRTPGWALQG